MANFAERIGQIKRDAFVGHGISIGLRLGLFETMGEMDRPVTPQELAEKADCKERYIKQWLGFMACSDIIKVQNGDEEERFFIPKERLPALTMSSGVENTLLMYGLPIFTGVQFELEDCFKKEGPLGIPPESWKGVYAYHQMLVELANPDDLVSTALSEIPGAEQRLGDGILVCEIGCGTGRTLQAMAQRFPKSQFLGIDISTDATSAANDQKMTRGLQNVNFEVQEASDLPSDWTERFDHVMLCDVLHDVGKPIEMLREIKRILKPGGVAYIEESHVKNYGAPNANQCYFEGLSYCIPACMYFGGPGYGPCWNAKNWKEILIDCGFNVNLHCVEEKAHFVCTK